MTRDLYWDSLKGLLIILVVLGHFTKKMVDIPAMGGLTTFIYIFHVSTFSFVSGFFSKNIAKQRAKDVTQILIPYLVFQVLYTAFFMKSLELKYFNPLRPTDHLWYLFALFIWRSVIPYFGSLRFPMGAAVGLSLAGGAFDLGSGFNLTLGFLPFFVAGYFFDEKRLLLLRKIKWYVGQSALIIVMFVCIALGKYNFFEGGNVFYFFWKPYSHFDAMPVKVLLPILRFGIMTLSSVMIVIVLASVKEMPFLARIGVASIYPYLVHNFLVIPVANSMPYIPIVSPLALVLMSVIIASLLSLQQVTKILSYVVFPDMKWLLKREH